jgi:hypothetical protein
MERKDIVVKIGKKGTAGYKEVPTHKWVWNGTDVNTAPNGVDAIVTLPTGVTAKDLATFINYGHMLKQRASARASVTDNGSKLKNRAKAQAWMFEKALAGDKSYYEQWQAENANDPKDGLKYLDELFASEPELGGEEE